MIDSVIEEFRHGNDAAGCPICGKCEASTCVVDSFHSGDVDLFYEGECGHSWRLKGKYEVDNGENELVDASPSLDNQGIIDDLLKDPTTCPSCGKHGIKSNTQIFGFSDAAREFAIEEDFECVECGQKWVVERLWVLSGELDVIV